MMAKMIKSGNFWFVVLMILGTILAFFIGLRNDVLPVNPESSIVVPREDGMMPHALVGFKKATGYVLWRRNIPMTGSGYMRNLYAPHIDGTEQLVVGFCYTSDGMATVLLYELKGGDRLVPESNGYKMKGEVLGEANHFLLANARF